MTSPTYTTVFIRRAASAALHNGFARQGLPPDLIVLPHRDDARRLHVISATQVLWTRSQHRARNYRAAVNFDNHSYCTGRIVANTVFDLIENPDSFEPELYALEAGTQGYAVDIRFDMSDIFEQEAEAWATLPFKPPPARQDFQQHIGAFAKRAMDQ
jgi:hypothetical protein